MEKKQEKEWVSESEELEIWKSWAKRFAENVQSYKAAIDSADELRETYRNEELLLAFYEPSAKELVRRWLSIMLNDAEYVLRHLK